jgi:Tfp pilus assembly protein PilZ
VQKLLLEFQNLDDARLVKKDFEKELPFEVIASLNHRETNRVLSNRSVQLIIYQTQEFKQPQIDRIHDLRRLGFTYPLLVITDKITPLIERFSVEEPRVNFLEKPFTLSTLRGLTKKLMVTKNIVKQQFKRYRTNQTASIETFVSGEALQTKMLNLSKGGAYFETEEKPDLSVGELLRLKFDLDQVEREHHIHGRIIWTTPKGNEGGKYGIGVKFIKQEDIYRHLLQSV